MQLDKSRFTPRLMRQLLQLPACDTPASITKQAGKMPDTDAIGQKSSDAGVASFSEQLSDQMRDIVDSYKDDTEKGNPAA
jgi:hypothetical protein